MKTYSTRKIYHLSLVMVVIVSSATTWFFTTKFNPSESEINLVNKNLSDVNIKSDTLTVLEKRLTELSNSIDQINKRHDLSQIKSIQEHQYVLGQLQAEGPDNQAEGEMDLTDQDYDEQAESDTDIAEQHYDEQVSLFETQLQSQPEDLEWSTKVQNDVLNVFDKSEHYTLENLSCKKTLCKLEANILQNDEDAGSSSFSAPPGIDHLLHGDLGWTGRAMYEIDSETGKVVVYLMHEDAELLAYEDG